MSENILKSEIIPFDGNGISYKFYFQTNKCNKLFQAPFKV